MKLKQKKAMIGDYNLTFDARSQFVYKTSKPCQGFFIRRRNWHSIFSSDELKEVTGIIKENIKTKYINVVERNMKIVKNQMLDKIASMNKDVL